MKNLLSSFFILLLIFSSAQAQDFSIVIDAQKDVFYDGLTNPNDGKIFIPSRAFLPEDTTIYGRPWGDEDISGIVWTAWDTTYLYYYVEVKDNIIVDNQKANWSNDKIEIKFDPNPTLKLTGQGNCIQVGMTAYDRSDAQLDTAVDNLDLDQKIAQGREMVDTSGNPYWSTQNDYARRKTTDGYVLEFRLPFKYINKGANRLRPVAVGLQFGSAINIADNDSIGRINNINWSAGHKDAVWNTPKYHGAVTLLDGHKCKYEAKSLQVDTIVNDSAAVWYFGGTPFVSVESNNNLPESFSLTQNYPNPFNPSTTIKFTLPQRSNVRLVLINMLGQVVKEITNNNYSAGSHQVTMDASRLASGIYFYKLQAGSFSDTKKLVLLK
jgi:hypothetical protein